MVRLLQKLVFSSLFCSNQSAEISNITPSFKTVISPSPELHFMSIKNQKVAHHVYFLKYTFKGLLVTRKPRIQKI